MSKESQATEGELLASLGVKSASNKRRVLHVLLALAVLAGVGAGVWAWRGKAQQAAVPEYRTAEARLADLRLTVTATGTLQGVDTVDVGTEVSGRVVDVLVDFNQPVKRGQVLARVDTEQLDAAVEQASAQLLAAQASVQNAEATQKEATAKLERTQRLVERGLLPRQDLETVQAAAERAQASTASARAQQTVALASLRAARTNRSRAEVRSPIDGMVLSRMVEPGQTVAASLQAPVLFTLARDLASLKLLVDVDEADVGKVTEEQPATFTVEAWPGREFSSRVLAVRNVPKAGTATGVVTYEAVLAVDNPEGLLRPGMTATATIVAEQHDQVLAVPTAALRFVPPDQAPPSASAGRGFRMPGLPRMGARPGAPGERPQRVRGQVLWVLAGGQPEPRQVQTGITDGRLVQITGGLEPGERVIVDAQARGSGS